MRKELPIVRVKTEKLVHGGQALGKMDNGKSIFVWNALPDEILDVQLTKQRRNYAEGVAIKVIATQPERISTLEPRDSNLSIQPWSIMSYELELESKAEIIKEAFIREGVTVDRPDIKTKGSLAGYRNKVEFGFFGNEQGIHYAHYQRASHNKTILEYPYNELIYDQIADTAQELLVQLNKLGIRAGDLKSVVFRADSRLPTISKVVAALFVKTEHFPKLDTSDTVVYYSDPKSPASVATKKLYQNGSTELVDTIKGVSLSYDVLSFFQVNIPIFEVAAQDIKLALKNTQAIDLYSGVGSIGLIVGNQVTALIESDENNIDYTTANSAGKKIKVVLAPSEKALDYIDGKHAVIVDPPRAGLHSSVVSRICEVKPPMVVYLSCNPSTQARDVSKLVAAGYSIKQVEGYNFFPRTPHVESLVVLELYRPRA